MNTRVARLIVAVTVTLVSAAAASPDRARASFPGENGRFVFSWSQVSKIVLATANAEAGDVRVVADPGEAAGAFSGDWSPNGRRLVYVFEPDKDPAELVMVRPNGSDWKVIYRGTQRFFFLGSSVWSPDGLRIAFVQYRFSTWAESWVGDIYTIRRDGTHLTQITSTRRSEEDLDWSSRGRLVFRRGGDLFTMRPNGLRLRRLTDGEALDHAPDWAPGGWRLTFARVTPAGSEIWKMHASGANPIRLAAGSWPTWAPDGSVIAFVVPDPAAVGCDGGWCGSEIRTVRPSGADETVIGSPVGPVVPGENEGNEGIFALDWQPR